MAQMFEIEHITSKVFSFVFAPSYPPSAIPTSPFTVCKSWYTFLSAPLFWQSLLNSFYPSFPLRHLSPSLHAPHKLYCWLRSILLVDNSHYAPWDPQMRKTHVEKKDLFAAKNKCKAGNEMLTDMFEGLLLHSFFDKYRLLPTYYFMYGPKGCGKSETVKTIAKVLQARFITLEYQTFLKYENDSDSIISYLYDIIPQASINILLVREVAGKYNRAACAFINFLDNKYKNATVWKMGTTSNPKAVNASIARRLNSSVYYPLPSDLERETFLAECLAQPSKELLYPIYEAVREKRSKNMKTLVERTQGLTFSELLNLCQQVDILTEAFETECAKFPRQYTPQDIYKLEHFDPDMLNASYLLSFSGGFDFTEWAWDKDGVRIKK